MILFTAGLSLIISVFPVNVHRGMKTQRGVRDAEIHRRTVNAVSAPAVRLEGLIDLRRKLRATFHQSTNGSGLILSREQVTVSLLFPNKMGNKVLRQDKMCLRMRLTISW